MLTIIGIIALVALVVIFAAFDVFWPFTVALALLAVGAWWREGLDIFWLLWRPEIIGAYIVIGLVWVFFKWARLVETTLNRQREYRHDILEPPQWADHSYSFAAYFFYWPADVIAYILSDLVREVWNFVASVIGGSFDRYAKWRFQQAQLNTQPAKHK